MEQDISLTVPAQARIVEIGEAGRSVSFSAGNIVVTGEAGVIERIPILEIAGIVALRPGLSWSGPALNALSERCVGIVVCDANHGSRMMSWPMHGRRWPPLVRAQLGLDAPLGRQLRRILVNARDAQREAVIEAMGKGSALKALRKAGEAAFGASRMSRDRCRADTERQISRRYWGWLAGPGFHRDPAKADGNAVINLAHTLLRIETVRAVHKAGLHPAVGLGGTGVKGGLIADLMLPYRPIVDLASAILVATGRDNPDDDTRATVAHLFRMPMLGQRGVMQIRMALEQLALSLAGCIERGKVGLEFRLPAVQNPSGIYDQMTEARHRDSEVGDRISGWG